MTHNLSHAITDDDVSWRCDSLFYQRSHDGVTLDENGDDVSLVEEDDEVALLRRWQ